MNMIPEVGDRVRITGIMPNEPHPLAIGDTGTVVRLGPSGSGQIHVDWDSGCTLILLAGDPYEVL